MEVIHL